MSSYFRIFALLKKIFSILFLSVYLIAAIEFHQLAKLPLLIEHFVEHKQNNNHLSVIDFLIMHYAQADDHDGDSDKDMKLPFKSHDRCISTLVLANVPNETIGIIAKLNYTDRAVRIVFSETFLPSFYLAAIWQPPKFC